MACNKDANKSNSGFTRKSYHIITNDSFSNNFISYVVQNHRTGMTEQAQAASIFVLRLSFLHYFTWEKDKVVLWSPVRSTFKAGHQCCSRVHSRQNMQSTSLKVMKTSSFFAMWKLIQRLQNNYTPFWLARTFTDNVLLAERLSLSLPAKLHFLVEYSHISNPQRLSA